MGMVGRLAIIAIMTAPNLLALLEEQARHDLKRLNYPANNWMPAARTEAGKPLLDELRRRTASTSVIPSPDIS